MDLSDPSSSSSNSGMSELHLRVISGTIMAVVALFAVMKGEMIFTALILLAGLQMIREWDQLTEDFNRIWKAVGLAYVALPCLSMLWLRGWHNPLNTVDLSRLNTYDAEKDGIALMVFLIGVIAATDIGAYFTGRTIGGPKLAPGISPGKTWAGLGGGMVAAGLSAGALCLLSLPFSFFQAIIIGTVLAVVAQGGDLFESWLKRRAGVKDSGKLLPGHGGILDRVDGLVFTAPLLALLVMALT